MLASALLKPGSKIKKQKITPKTRKLLITIAIADDVLRVSTTTAAPSPTIPVKIRTAGMRNARRTRVEGGFEWWTKHMAINIASNSRIMPKERRARVGVVRNELDVSNCTWMATIATAVTTSNWHSYPKERDFGTSHSRGSGV